MEGLPLFPSIANYTLLYSNLYITYALRKGMKKTTWKATIATIFLSVMFSLITVSYIENASGIMGTKFGGYFMAIFTPIFCMIYAWKIDQYLKSPKKGRKKEKPSWFDSMK